MEDGSSASDDDVEAMWRAEEAAADFEQRRSEEAMAEEAAAVALAEARAMGLRLGWLGA